MLACFQKFCQNSGRTDPWKRQEHRTNERPGASSTGEGARKSEKIRESRLADIAFLHHCQDGCEADLGMALKAVAESARPHLRLGAEKGHCGERPEQETGVD